jgi:hypothetical protein
LSCATIDTFTKKKDDVIIGTYLKLIPKSHLSNELGLNSC